MVVDKQVRFSLKAKDETLRAKKSAESNIKALGNVARTFGPIIAGAFGASVISKSVQAYVKQEQAIFQLEQRLKSTRDAAGLTSQELQALAGALQKTTTFGDEATIEMEALLLTFTNIRGEIFKAAVPAILDMSTAMGQDLKSSSLQLGKALNDPLQGISALTRVGVTFTDAQKEQIRAMVESGRVAEAQSIILRELQTEFGGAAKAARQGLGGALTALENKFGDVLEASVKLAGGDSGAPGMINTLTAAMYGLERALLDVDKALDDLLPDWMKDAGGDDGLKDSLVRSIPGIGPLVGLVEFFQKYGELQDLQDKNADQAGKRFKIPRIEISGPGGSGGVPVSSSTPKGFFDDAWNQAALQNSIEDISNFTPKLKPVFEKPEFGLGFDSVDILGNVMAKEAAQEQLDALRFAMMSEEEFVRASYQNRKGIVQEALAQGLIQKQEFYAIEGELAQERENELTRIHWEGLSDREKFEQSSWQDRLSTVAGDMQRMTQLSAGSNQAMFRANQAARVLEAGQEAVSGAIKTWNSVPYPWNIPLTALHVAGRAAYMKNLIGAKPQGEGTRIGSGGGTNTSPIVTQPMQSGDRPMELTVVIQGPIIGEDAWVENNLIPTINRAVGRGVTIKR